jgi:hypothetical protein
MINEKETLKKWHEMNPELTTDQLLQLLDGVVEKVEWSTTPYNPTTITYRERTPDYTVTCSQNKI